MRLLLISDIHGDVQKIPCLKKVVTSDRLDAIVICGDITHFGSLVSASLVFESLGHLGLPVFFVPGNCDPRELASKTTFKSSENLHGRCVMVFGRSMLGVGGCASGPFKTPFELSEAETAGVLENALGGCSFGSDLIVVSHDAPYGTRVDLTSFGQHVGSKVLREFVLSKNPILLMCGHIHEARGTDLLGATYIVNPGPLYRGFYSLVEIDGRVEATLHVFEKKG